VTEERTPILPPIAQQLTSEQLRRRVLALLAAMNGKAAKR
jgi:hypothetical protein